MKKIVMGAVLVSLFAGVWSARAMDQALDGRALAQQGDEEKGAPEIELLISHSAVSGSTAAGSANVSSGVQPGPSWTDIQAFLSDADRQELTRNHTSQQLEEVFKTFIRPQDPADCMQDFLLALIKHDKARLTEAVAKNVRDYDSGDVFIKSFLLPFSLASIAIVIILCGAIRIQCGN